MEKKAVFAAGCFWGVEAAFKLKKAVIKTCVGYTGGKRKNPSYEQVCSGATGHAEAVEIIYNDELISFDELIEYFFSLHDPTSLNKQGGDIGSQYRTAIFYVDDVQKEKAISIIASHNQKKTYARPIVTTVEKLEKFYPAEEYHQNYLNKNPNGHCHINLNALKKDL